MLLLIKKMLEVMSHHATERQHERGIKKAYIDLCIGKGSRSNVERREGSMKWCFKYAFHGLHVVCGVEKAGSTPLVITAYWVSYNLKEVNRSMRLYDEMLMERSSKKKARRQGQKKRKIDVKGELYDDPLE